MNIAELTILGVTSSPSATQSTATNPSDKTNGDFESLLSDIMSQLNGVGQAVDTSGSDAVKEALLMKLVGVDMTQALVTPLASDAANQLKELSDAGNQLKELGDKLLAMLSQMLQGGQVDNKKEELLPLLNNIINSLQAENDNSESQKALIKLFVNVKERLSNGGLKDKLKGLLDGLPEDIKLKLRLSVHQNGKQLPQHDIALIQYKLVANLVGLADTGENVNPDMAKSGSQSVLPNEGLTRLNEKLMVKFHLNALSGNDDMQSNAAAPADVQAGSIDQGLLDVAKDTTGARAKQDAVSNSALNAAEVSKGSDAKDVALILEKGSSELKQVLEPSSAKPETIADGSGVKNEGLHLALGKAEHSAESDSQLGAQSDKDMAAPSSAASTNTQQPYGVAQTKGSFTDEMSKATASSQSTPQASEKAEGAGSNVIKQIVEKFDVSLAEGRSEARIQLHPKNLGEIKIHLTVENGSMKAVLDATSHQVKEILESNLANLRQSLEEHGLQVKEFSVSVGHHKEDNNHSQGFKHHGRGGFAGQQAASAVAREIQSARASFGLNGEKLVNCLA